MAAEQFEGARWALFFDNLTETLVAEQAEIEVASLDLGDQTEAEWAPLIGITYDKKGDLIEIHLEDLDHLIRSPREVFIDYASAGSSQSRSTRGGWKPADRQAEGFLAPPGAGRRCHGRGGPVIPVLLNVAPDGRQESRLRGALALVKYRGHITCLQIVGAMSAVPDPATATTEAEAFLDVEVVAHEFRKTVDAGLGGAHADWAWLRFYGDPATILIERSRFADLIVMSADDSFPPISCVALHTRTPVLAVRQGKRNFISWRCWP